MMTFIPTTKLAADFGDFYVPRFELRIAGAELPGEVLRDVSDVSYTDHLEAIDGFQLTVNNWNEATQTFKYLGAEDDTPAQQELEQLFDPCNKNVDLKLGYGDELELMMTGNFTTIEPHFPGSAPPTLTVRGLNVLHQLRRKQYTHAWVGQTDSQIADNLATLTDRDTGRRRFPIPIVTNAPRGEPEIDYVAQRNQYDIDFLFQRARERGYIVTTRPRANARDPHDIELYFGPSDVASAGEPPAFELAWRKGLVEFQPTLTTANQVSSVTVSGWNRNTRQPIRETVGIDDRRLNVNGDLRRQLGQCDRREEIVVDEPMFTPRQAYERARAILRNQEYARVKATGSCIGFPGLRAGRKVMLVGLGRTFSGVYLLTSTTHTINDAGYTVRFEACRDNLDDAEPARAGGPR